MWVDLAILWCVYVLIALFGYLQQTPSDKYQVLSTLLLVAAAIYIVAYLSFMYPFDILAISLACAIIAHHMIIHRNTDFSGEPTFLTLQVHDVCNHETWMVANFTAAIVWHFSQKTCTI